MPHVQVDLQRLRRQGQLQANGEGIGPQVPGAALQHHQHAITGVQTPGLITGKTVLGKHEVALRRGRRPPGKLPQIGDRVGMLPRTLLPGSAKQAWSTQRISLPLQRHSQGRPPRSGVRRQPTPAAGVLELLVGEGCCYRLRGNAMLTRPVWGWRWRPPRGWAAWRASRASRHSPGQAPRHGGSVRH